MDRSQANRQARNAPAQPVTLAPRPRCGSATRLYGVGRFAWMGGDFKVSWADTDESRRIRHKVFDLGNPDH
jgi:hypothetical protein